MVNERVVTRDPTVAAWTVSWSGIWIGAFTAVVAVTFLGFAGTALGAALHVAAEEDAADIACHDGRLRGLRTGLHRHRYLVHSGRL